MGLPRASLRESIIGLRIRYDLRAPHAAGTVRNRFVSWLQIAAPGNFFAAAAWLRPSRRRAWGTWGRGRFAHHRSRWSWRRRRRWRLCYRARRWGYCAGSAAMNGHLHVPHRMPAAHRNFLFLAGGHGTPHDPPVPKPLRVRNLWRTGCVHGASPCVAAKADGLDTERHAS